MMRTATILTSVPERHREARMVFETLRRQSDVLYVHLVDYPCNPSWCNPADVVVQHRTRRGPTVALGLVPESVDIVLMVDDDLIYPDNYVEHIVGAFERLGPNTAISYHVSWWHEGDRLRFDCCQAIRLDDHVAEDSPATVLGTGVSAFWRNEFHAFDREPPPEFEHHRDLWTSYQAAHAGVRIVRPRSAKDWIGLTPAAHRGLWTKPGRLDANERVAERLRDYYGWSPVLDT